MPMTKPNDDQRMQRVYELAVRHYTDFLCMIYVSRPKAKIDPRIVPLHIQPHISYMSY
jgi:hypothetical protein